MRSFIELSYDGTHYHGWQVQPNAVTVQARVNEALTTILRTPVQVVGAGRTDTGVHARFFVAHFDIAQAPCMDLHLLVYKLNQYLPKDIAVQKIYEVAANAHARFDALSRTYHYYITKEKNPFRETYAYHCPYQLDLVEMNKAASLLFQYKDFTSFSKLHTDVKTNLCTIMKAEWSETEDLLVFEIQADRFLRNMVRAIVGTLIDVGRGKLKASQMTDIIEAKNRSKAKGSAAAKGLFLTGIAYDVSVVLKRS